MQNITDGLDENTVTYVLEPDTDILAFGDFIDYFTSTEIKLSKLNASALRDLAVKFGLRQELIECIDASIATLSNP